MTNRNSSDNECCTCMPYKDAIIISAQIISIVAVFISVSRYSVRSKDICVPSLLVCVCVLTKKLFVFLLEPKLNTVVDNLFYHDLWNRRLCLFPNDLVLSNEPMWSHHHGSL
mmetsp:Transcript_13123/g.22933  ORF Transcript_13123/g.22933 Transcript_13123/m.22933 type:complete len:112 (+) Transcript_13123:122-457(+)